MEPVVGGTPDGLALPLIAYIHTYVHTPTQKSYNMVPLIATAKHGRPSAVIRIVEWSVTVPFLLSLVGAHFTAIDGNSRINQSTAQPPNRAHTPRP